MSLQCSLSLWSVIIQLPKEFFLMVYKILGCPQINGALDEKQSLPKSLLLPTVASDTT